MSVDNLSCEFMTNSRYLFEKVIVIKIILENLEGEILLVKEPDTNKWMPGHWGLPGGKILEKESLLNAFKRKAKSDLGLDLKPLGIFKIEELLMDSRTVLMFHLVAMVKDDNEIKGEIAASRWVGIKEIEAMEIKEFTEFFNKNLINEYLSGNREVINLNLIETQKFYNMSEDSEYKKWFMSGKK